MGKILLWIASVFMLLSGIVFFPSIASILMLITGIFIIPIKPLGELRKKFIPSKALGGIIIAVLIIASFLTVPTDDSISDVDPGNIEENISITETTDTLSEQEMQAPETDSPATETQAPETDPPAAETQTLETDSPAIETQATETDPPAPETQAPETNPPKQETEPPETTPLIIEPTIPENSTFGIRFIDVGQADAALVECDGHYMLIDGGNKGDSSLIYTVLKIPKCQSLIQPVHVPAEFPAVVAHQPERAAH